MCSVLQALVRALLNFTECEIFIWGADRHFR